jgi:hypothetical protein
VARPDTGGHGGHGGHGLRISEQGEWDWAPPGVAGECLHRVKYVLEQPAAQVLSLDSAQDRARLLSLIKAELEHL